ncbi:AAA family ATPase [Sphingobium sp. B11D3D]|uniref:AAA family ATPase n=1 Tax=Sphingobium sp. B11D3D TaxID=2940576 RepID=UPI0022241EC7|nr:AAA family ATPase [Sphingobium sp. B11D3D]
MYSLQEVVEAFGDQLPEHIINSLSAPPPEHLSALISQIDCHLIETQRLVVLQTDDYRRPSSSTLAISRKAQTLKAIVAKELAAYAAISQSLDRSFPRRVLQQGQIEPASGLTSALTELDNLRYGLTEAGILDPEAEDALPPIEQTNSAIAAVLSVYVEDTRKKLDVLASLREKILLFKELIDGRFFPKYVVVDKDVGFIVNRSPTFDVPLEKLSSGEQHQLVLFFELLFELKKNSLILIDEPELSLHVAWQKQFISDLKRIIELNEFDVLLATHSPQLIGEWEDLVVEIGNVDCQ